MRKSRNTGADKQGKFVREVGGVVLGVLIALGIGEAADLVRWKMRVADTLTTLRTELAGNRWNVVERQNYQPCLERRIALLGDILGDARRTGQLPSIDMVGGPGYRLVQSSAYDVSQSEGVPLHMDREQGRTIARLYGLSGTYREWADREQQRWNVLRLMEGPGGPVSGEILAVLLQAWSNAKLEGHMVGLAASQIDQGMKDFNIPAGEGADEWNAEKLKAQLTEYKLCKPITVAGKVQA